MAELDVPWVSAMRRVRFHDPTGEPARWRQRSRPPRGDEPRGGVVCGGRVEGVELPGVAAGWADSAGIARSGGRDRRGSRRCSAACSPERWGEPVLWLTGLESTRGRVAGTEGSAGAGARSRGRGSFGSEDSWHDPEDRPSAVGGHQATGSPGHVMKLRSARRPCCTFEPLRSTRAARTMTRTQMARRSAEARRDTDLQ